MSVKRSSIKLPTPYKGSYMSKLIKNKSLCRGGNEANIKVVVRVRPENETELQENHRCVVEVIDENMLIFDPKDSGQESFFYQGVKQKCRDLRKRAHKDSKFMFDRVFDKDSTNQEVFEETAKSILDAVLEGYNCSVFAYGATGSGKTYTMLGKEGDGGIAFRTVMELFDRITNSDGQCSTEIGVSYLEIYNETVRDLLCEETGLRVLDIRENNGTVSVPGLSLHKPSNAESLLSLMLQGNERRSQHPTDANKESSRSHAVFQVFVKQQVGNSGVMGDIKIGKLSLIDLAGSEKGAATGFGGARFREGTNINKSLLALGNCINALADGLKHIPYRNSKLTRLIKDSIGGNCQTVMIANVGPTSRNFDDTHNTLQYATRAKNIKVNLKKNIRSVEYHISQYPKIIEKLMAERNLLKEQVVELRAQCQALGGEGLPPELVKSEVAMSQGNLADHQEVVSTVCKAVQTDDFKEANFNEELEQLLLPLFRSKRSLQREINVLKQQEKEVELKISRKNYVLNRFGDLVLFEISREKSAVKYKGTIEALQNKSQRLEKSRLKIQGKLNELMDKLDQSIKNIEKTCPDPSILNAFLTQQKLKCLIRELEDSNAYSKLVANFRNNEAHNMTEWVESTFPFLKHLYQILKGSGRLTSGDDEKYYAILNQVCEAKEVCWADLVPEPPVVKRGLCSELSIYECVDLSPVKASDLVVSCSKRLDVGQRSSPNKAGTRDTSPVYDCNIELDVPSGLRLLKNLNTPRRLKDSIGNNGRHPDHSSRPVRSPHTFRDPKSGFVSSTPLYCDSGPKRTPNLFRNGKKSPNRVFVPETPPARAVIRVSPRPAFNETFHNVDSNVLNVTRPIIEEENPNTNSDTFCGVLDLTTTKCVHSDSYIVNNDVPGSCDVPSVIRDFPSDLNSTFVANSKVSSGSLLIGSDCNSSQFRTLVSKSAANVITPTPKIPTSSMARASVSRLLTSSGHNRKIQRPRSSLTNIHKRKKVDYFKRPPPLDRIRAKENSDCLLSGKQFVRNGNYKPAVTPAAVKPASMIPSSSGSPRNPKKNGLVRLGT